MQHSRLLLRRGAPPLYSPVSLSVRPLHFFYTRKHVYKKARYGFRGKETLTENKKYAKFLGIWYENHQI